VGALLKVGGDIYLRNPDGSRTSLLTHADSHSLAIVKADSTGFYYSDAVNGQVDVRRYTFSGSTTSLTTVVGESVVLSPDNLWMAVNSTGEDGQFWTIQSVASVPEPSTFLLLLPGLALIIGRRRRG
jgi:hypothetical protein